MDITYEGRSLRLYTNESIDSVISLYSDMVYRLAFSHTGSKSDADDIFQEVFLKLIDCTTPFQSEEHRKAWLIRVTINCCNQLWRSAWRRRTVPLDHLPEESEETIFPQESALFCALQKLPAKDRDLIHLFYYEQLSVREITSILSQRESTIRSRLTRIRQKLKSILEEDN